MNKDYISMTDFMNGTITGEINITQGLKIYNKYKTQSCFTSYLENLLYICKKDNKDVLNILFDIKNKIEKNMCIHIDRNFYIKQFIREIISNWNVDIDASEIFDKYYTIFDYNIFSRKSRIRL